jgi:phage shock protein PspC (stress-responsive transcriptional regulator)
MTDEAARRPMQATEPDATATAAPPPSGAADAPPPSVAADAPPPSGAADAPPTFEPPPSSDPPPPGGGYGPPSGFPFAARYGLVRPREGRYIAGVCAAIGRATNTDPVLWRVLLAVLGFFGGIGILVYVAAWLIIPAEGDTASPVESMLGRGRSSMSPVTVILLGVLIAVIFAFIVTDGFSSVLLGTAILVAGALLLNREANRQRPPAGPVTPGGGPTYPTAFPGGPYPGPATPAPAAAPTMPPAAPTMHPAAPTAADPGYPPVATEPAAGQEAPTHPFSATGALGPHTTPATGEPTYPDLAGMPPTYPAPSPAPGQAGGYRAPFAPYGPYGGGPTYPPSAPPTGSSPRPPRPPRERSPLGAATFSLIFVVIGLIAVLDLADVLPVGPSAYFAGVLVTTALGLLVAAWFGRARWLIAIGLVAAIALGIATLAESSGVSRVQATTVVWQPTTLAELTDQYENSFGDATLDLRAVDLGAAEREVTARVNFGRLVVLVPPEADVTAFADVNAGDATVFGQKWSGVHGSGRELTDLGPDGRGGGELRLLLHVNAGQLEVRR